MDNMRFHVISLPHTNTTKDFENCAYTVKVRRFCNMMKSLGHTVYLYAGEENEADVNELITCITEEQRLEALGGLHYVSASFDNTLPHWQIFAKNAIEGIKQRAEQKDFLCFIGGTAQQPIAEAFPDMISVEFGIGYGGTFSNYRVFESYAWMHSIYAMHTNPTTVNGKFFDAVIPGYLDPEMFPFQEKKEDYYLYMGRMISRKGVQIASETCRELGVKLIMAGPGDEIPEYGEYIGAVGPEERAKLMGGAIGFFAPTLYIEPFGNVVIESQACGTPTITTDFGAFTETNVNGLTGYRCRTLDEFCKAAEDVKSLDPAIISKRAKELYSVDIIRYKYDEYFRRLQTLWGKGWYERS
jgi:glycosyltransferase involved in cell wall biosynthesis